MEVKILINEKNVLEVELDSDQSLAQLIAERLTKESDVEFAAFKKEHPIIGRPKIYLKTKKSSPVKLLLEVISQVKDEMSDFKKQVLSISK
ncbi:hypothetical protein HZC07_02660 [Candidatus Micrarchaeota archaeon]|nr:hypothetical protein [Candidatus Micrarchaeota archaeon]